MSDALPTSAADVLDVIAHARESKEPMWFAGSGSTQAPEAHAVVRTAGLTGIVDYKPDDLTVVVRSGTTLEALDETLREHGHTAVLPEIEPHRTVGGVVASGASGFRRLRYGPTRDRVIGATVVTGYGETVHAGGQLVKNVTGFDLPRLLTGSHGSLGFIVDVSLKLWPIPKGRRTIPVDDVAGARLEAYQPIAALETEDGGFLHVSDSDGADEGFAWPTSLTHDTVLTINVPPRHLRDAVDRVDSDGATGYHAQHGVGAIDAGWDSVDDIAVTELRGWTESLGGSLVVRRRGGVGSSVSKWGSDPESIGIQQRMKDLFDPDRVCNPGVLPGGV